MEQVVNELSINGVVCVPKSDAKQDITSDIKIVVLQRGWVVVGRFERKDTQCKLHNASVVRIWGTTNGLGEIAEGGPTSSTKLDKCNGIVEFDYMTVVFTLDCEPKKWQNKL
jgi:hypothetical protein